MLLKLDLQEIPKIKPSSLHLRELSCKPHHVTNTTALFQVPFEGCGTTRGTYERYIKFSNAVENSLSLNESRWVIVRHVPEFHFPFMCYYRPKYVITVQEGEGYGTGNDTKKRPKVEGEKQIWLTSNQSLIYAHCKAEIPKTFFFLPESIVRTTLRLSNSLLFCVLPQVEQNFWWKIYVINEVHRIFFIVTLTFYKPG